VSRAFAAGASFSNRTLKAEWAARQSHTSVIDAVSGAIYVIGGSDGVTRFHDVLVSTDGGALPDSVKELVGGYTKGVLQVLLGTTGTLGYYKGTQGLGTRGYYGVPLGC
jgi:hypothetical protein